MSDFSASSLFNVNGLVAVITGGGSGLGAMTAKALDANGAKAVYIIGRREASLAQTQAAGTNGSIRPLVADVSSKESLAAAAKKIKDEVGYVNVVFANAGISGKQRATLLKPNASVQEFQEAFWEAPMEEFTEILHVNITGVWYTALAFLELLDRGNKEGNVVQKSQVVITNSGSAFARVAATGIDYGASKAGVTHLAKIMATSFAPYKIRVNCIAPGFYPTEMTDGHPIRQGCADATVEGSIPAEKVPLQRIGNERDFAGATLFLMSEAGGYVNGNVLLTDGGRISTLPSTY